MGAETFFRAAEGRTADEAFRTAKEDARHMHGHGGYSGTIAEKTNFTLIFVPLGKDPRDFANELIDSDDRRISNKWGPAGCIALGHGRFLFFGWASS